MTIRLPLLYYFSLIVLVVALVIQLAQWKHASETQSGLAQVENTRTNITHTEWREQVSDAEERQHRLETQLLWREPESLLPAVAKLSEGLSISLVGVEGLQERSGGDYGFYPLRLTFSGDYGTFASLLDVAEQLEPAVRIEEIRLYRRKRGADALWLDMTLAAMQKTVESDERRVESEKRKVATNPPPPVAIKIPTIEGFFVSRDPFAFVSPMPQSGGAPGRANDTPLPKLTGILWDDESPIALFDDGNTQLSAGVGEVIGGTTVLSIEPQEVVLKRDTQQTALNLWTNQRRAEHEKQTTPLVTVFENKR